MGNNTGFSLLAMMLSIVIIALMGYFLVKTYFTKPPIDKQTEQSMKEQGINSAYPSMVTGAKDRVQSFNKSTNERLDQINREIEIIEGGEKK